MTVIDEPTRTGDLAEEVAAYLVFKRKRLTAASRRAYRAALEDLVRAHPDLGLAAFEPPAGTRMVEDFLTCRWGSQSPRTYNKNLSMVGDFFKWQVRRGALLRDPMLSIERARPRAVHRTTFTAEQRALVLRAATDPRDRVALRLLLDYGIRKGALQGVRLEHFDRATRRLIVFTKGEKIQQVPLPDNDLWDELDDLREAEHHFLLPRQTLRRRRPPHRRQFDALRRLLDEASSTAESVDDPACAREIQAVQETITMTVKWLDLAVLSASVQVRRYPDEPMGDHGLHDWWYRCLARAGIVPEGTTRGERMHKARHTAGQRVLDSTGNLKAAQALLGHANISTTGNEYTDWDIGQLTETLRDVARTRADVVAR